MLTTENSRRGSLFTMRRHFIREWLEEIGWTAADLVRHADLDKGSVSRWLNKDILPQKPNLRRIAKAFRVEPESLLRRPDDAWFGEFLKGRPSSEKKTIKDHLLREFPMRPMIGIGFRSGGIDAGAPIEALEEGPTTRRGGSSKHEGRA